MERTRFVHRLESHPGKLIKITRNNRPCNICEMDVNKIILHDMTYLIGSCPTSNCPARFRIRTCRRTQSSDFWCSLPDHACQRVDPGTNRIPEEVRVLVGELLGQSKGAKAIHEIVRQIHDVTLTQVLSTIRFHRRRQENERWYAELNNTQTPYIQGEQLN